MAKDKKNTINNKKIKKIKRTITPPWGPTGGGPPPIQPQDPWDRPISYWDDNKIDEDDPFVTNRQQTPNNQNRSTQNTSNTNANQIYIFNNNAPLKKAFLKTIKINNNEYHISSLKDITKNYFRGDFISSRGISGDRTYLQRMYQQIFLNSILFVGENVFQNHELTFISMPHVIEIDDYGFERNELNMVFLPKIEVIKQRAFMYNKIAKLDFPQVKQIDQYAFHNNPLKEINIPNCENIAFGAFDYDNDPTYGRTRQTIQKVIMKRKFNTIPEKNKIFGTNKWNNIQFTWVD